MNTQVETIDLYIKAGEKKASSKFTRVFLLAVLAGLLIGLGGAVTNMATHGVPNVSAAKIISAALFPFGLIMVIFTGAELFTGNCLLAIPVADKKITFGSMLRNWACSYVGNFVGAALLAALLCLSGHLNASNGDLALYTMKVATTKCSISFGSGIILGFFCNVLVCLGVIMAFTAKSAPGKMMGAYVPVFFFVACGFEHCIANMYYIPAGLFAKAQYSALALDAGLDLSALTWTNFLVGNLLPVTIGNIIGGAFVGLLLWYTHRAKA